MLYISWLSYGCGPSYGMQPWTVNCKSFREVCKHTNVSVKTADKTWHWVHKGHYMPDRPLMIMKNTLYLSIIINMRAEVGTLRTYTHRSSDQSYQGGKGQVLSSCSGQGHGQERNIGVICGGNPCEYQYNMQTPQSKARYMVHLSTKLYHKH